MIAALRDLVRSRELLLTMVERQLRLRAKRSWLSNIWPIAAPFFLMALYVFVFRRVFDVPIQRYPTFLLCGLLPWTFLTQALGRTIGSISDEPELIRKAPFAYELLPLSRAAAHAVNFLITVVLFVGFLALTGDLPLGTLPALALPIASVVLLVMSISMVVALIDVYNHDLQLVLSNLLTIWFFLLPIVYAPRMAPRSLEVLKSIDPMNLIVTQMRAVLYYGEVVRPDRLLLMVALCTVFFLGSLALFRSFSSQLPKDV